MFFEVKSSKRGRGLFASCDIKAGTTILREPCYASVLVIDQEENWKHNVSSPSLISELDSGSKISSDLYFENANVHFCFVCHRKIVRDCKNVDKEVTCQCIPCKTKQQPDYPPRNFCSEECRASLIHQDECPNLNRLFEISQKTGVDFSLVHLIYRIIIHSLRESRNMDKMQLDYLPQDVSTPSYDYLVRYILSQCWKQSFAHQKIDDGYIPQNMSDYDQNIFSLICLLETHRNDFSPQVLHLFYSCAKSIYQIIQPFIPPSNGIQKDDSIMHMVLNRHSEINIARISFITIELIVDLFCIIFVNAHGLCPDGHQDYGIALFPVSSLLCHDCIPNCYFSTQTKGNPPEKGEDLNENHSPTIYVHSLRDIKKGEELTLSYVDLMKPTHIRREELLKSKYFICNCVRCESESECGRFLRAYKCTKCDDGFLVQKKEEVLVSKQVDYTLALDYLKELDDDDFFDQYDDLINRDDNDLSRPFFQPCISKPRKETKVDHRLGVWKCEKCQFIPDGSLILDIHKTEEYIEKDIFPKAQDLRREGKYTEAENLLVESVLKKYEIEKSPSKKANEAKINHPIMHSNHYLLFQTYIELLIGLDRTIQFFDSSQQDDTSQSIVILRAILQKSLHYYDRCIEISLNILPQNHIEISHYQKKKGEVIDKLKMLGTTPQFISR